MRGVSEETFWDDKHAGYGNTRAEPWLPKICVHLLVGVYLVGYCLPAEPWPSCSASPDVWEQMRVIPHVAVQSVSGQRLICQLKVDMFCNVPKWWRKFFLTLDGKSICALEHGDCHLYSSPYHREQYNYSSDGWWTSCSTFVVLLWKKEFFPLDCPSKYSSMVSGFLCLLQHEENSCSMTLINTLRLSGQNGSHRPSRREELNLADYCLLVTPWSHT